MPNKQREIALLRVLCGLAWADGQISPDERRFLQGLAVEFGLKPEEALQIDELLTQPISLEDFERLVVTFRGTVGTSAEETQLLDRAERMILVDGDRDLAEARYISLIREWLSEEGEMATQPVAQKTGGFFSRLRDVLDKTRSGGTPALSSLVGELAGKATDDGDSLAIADAGRLHYVTLFGSLLYRVIYADQVVDPKEAVRMREILRNDFSFADGEVDYMIRVIQRRVAADIDRQRLCAEFNRITGLGERLTLLKALFTVAQADGQADQEELKEIRLISNYLWIDVQDFVRVRQKVLER